MKKLSTLVILFVMAFAIAGCSITSTNQTTTAGTYDPSTSAPLTTASSTTTTATATDTLSSVDSLATLSYLSAGLLDMQTGTVSQTLGFRTLDATTTLPSTTAVDGQMAVVNQYFDLLKAFAENGVNGFGTITDGNSDRSEYTYRLTIKVMEDTYQLYYNVDASTGDISGVFVIGTVEYTITASDNLPDAHAFRDGDHHPHMGTIDNSTESVTTTNEPVTTLPETTTTEATTTVIPDTAAPDTTTAVTTEPETTTALTTDTSTVDTGYRMDLLAVNGDDSIHISYKTDTTDETTMARFELAKDIAGEQSFTDIKVIYEDQSYKVMIDDNGNQLDLMKVTEDQTTYYMLHYRVDGVQGVIRATESVDANGNIVYTYDIQENGHDKEMTMGRPHSHGYDGGEKGHHGHMNDSSTIA